MLSLRGRLALTGAGAATTALGTFLYTLNPGPMIGLGRAVATAVGATVVVTAALVTLLSPDGSRAPRAPEAAAAPPKDERGTA